MIKHEHIISATDKQEITKIDEEDEDEEDDKLTF
jgi:hypothetical protein